MIRHKTRFVLLHRESLQTHQHKPANRKPSNQNTLRYCAIPQATKTQKTRRPRIPSELIHNVKQLAGASPAISFRPVGRVEGPAYTAAFRALSTITFNFFCRMAKFPTNNRNCWRNRMWGDLIPGPAPACRALFHAFFRVRRHNSVRFPRQNPNGPAGTWWIRVKGGLAGQPRFTM